MFTKKNPGKGSVVHENFFKAKWHRKCSALGCNSVDVKMFQFPKNERYRNQWIQLLRVRDVRLQLHACLKHFEEKYWQLPKLPVHCIPKSVSMLKRK